MTTTLTIHRYLARERDIRQLCRALAEIDAELATLPEAEIGSPACLQRLIERRRVLGWLAGRGVVN